MRHRQEAHKTKLASNTQAENVNEPEDFELFVNYISPRRNVFCWTFANLMRSSLRNVSSELVYPSGMISSSGESLSNHWRQAFSLAGICLVQNTNTEADNYSETCLG